MTNRLHIIEILENGERTLGRKSISVNLFFLAVAIILTCCGIRVSKDYVELTISSLAIFTGFYFTLIVYVTDKTVTKVDAIRKMEKEMNTSNLLKEFASEYKDFSKNLIAQISYSIVLAIMLIFISLLTQAFEEDYHCCWKNIDFPLFFREFTTTVFLFLIGKMLHMILLIISNMQAFFMQELFKSERRL